MFDVGAMAGWPKNRVRAGFGYQYWNNKFGYTAATTGGKGYRASTPMLPVEYHL